MKSGTRVTNELLEKEDDAPCFWDRFDDWSIVNTFQSIGGILFTVVACVFIFQYMSYAWHQHTTRGQPQPVTFVVAESLIAEVRANTPMLNFASNQIGTAPVFMHSIDLTEITPEIAVKLQQHGFTAEDIAALQEINKAAIESL